MLILRIYWDGEDYPSVECPIGDFFGIGHCEYKHYMSKYIGMSSGGFYCYFPMPFKKVRIEVENLHHRLTTSVFLNANYDQLEIYLRVWDDSIVYIMLVPILVMNH